MTYLQIVNSVLARLREDQVTSVSATDYSRLIGKFVNDAKRQVEDAWKWDAMSKTLPLTTAVGVSTYVLTGSGLKPKHISANNITNKNPLYNVPIKWIFDQQQLASVSNSPPNYYAWNGNDGTDSKVELFPTPNGAYSLKFNLYVQQPELVNDSDVLILPSEAIEMGAYARALVERGEDGGLSSSEAYGLYKGILADQIALEASRFVENDVWVPV
jgi:hypothetical protein